MLSSSIFEALSHSTVGLENILGIIKTGQLYIYIFFFFTAAASLKTLKKTFLDFILKELTTLTCCQHYRLGTLC